MSGDAFLMKTCSWLKNIKSDSDSPLPLCVPALETSLFAVKSCYNIAGKTVHVNSETV